MENPLHDLTYEEVLEGYKHAKENSVREDVSLDYRHFWYGRSSWFADELQRREEAGHPVG
jgi:hypothetical protein